MPPRCSRLFKQKKQPIRQLFTKRRPEVKIIYHQISFGSLTCISENKETQINKNSSRNAIIIDPPSLHDDLPPSPPSHEDSSPHDIIIIDLTDDSPLSPLSHENSPPSHDDSPPLHDNSPPSP
ncbi:24589_t:CDS:1 [Dentiscutata erythropus]|uniref:24589_t:CDS:1 n=1 Tax=Dentiscutata erythropus TaxID=1348616 RepID=A0A9N9IGR9_9GLOM|nr:24589_t:CDS:1 [Dentiscutata erythropus]